MKFIPIMLVLHGAWLPMQAATLYSQGGAVNNGWYSDASLKYPQSLGDNFQATASWRVWQLVWRGMYDNNALPEDSFLVNVWTTGGNGLPTATLTLDRGAVTRTATGGQTSWGTNMYEYSMELNQPLLLSPGNYVLEVQNNTPSTPSNWGWLTTNSVQKFFYNNEGWYAGDYGNLQFTIQGEVVPEPGAAMLLTLAGAAALGRRSRSAR